MKSVKALGLTPTSLPLSADNITELHAARLLLLIHHCGSSDNITGLTKLAKLDFFVRYPDFFERAAKYLGTEIRSATDQTESHMVRHHYGPWDKRYYQVLAFLEARGLISVRKISNTFHFSLTDLGKTKSKLLSKSNPFVLLVAQMKTVKSVLKGKTGTQLKNIVYEVFDEEVKQRSLGEVIR